MSPTLLGHLSLFFCLSICFLLDGTPFKLCYLSVDLGKALQRFSCVAQANCRKVPFIYEHHSVVVLDLSSNKVTQLLQFIIGRRIGPTVHRQFKYIVYIALHLNTKHTLMYFYMHVYLSHLYQQVKCLTSLWYYKQIIDKLQFLNPI